MKNIMTCTLFSVSCAIANYSFASDGIVQFVGHATEESCDLSINGNGSSDGTVVIPSVNLSDLTVASGAERTSFTIAMRNCNTNNQIRPYFESNNAGPNGYLANTTSSEDGGARLINLAIYNEDGDVLNIGGANSDSLVPFKPVSGTEEVMFKYAVAVTGNSNSATIGRVNSSLVYSIEYQ